MDTNGSLLSATALWKTYSAVALGGVDFDLRCGEVHALVGENGAGKSTLAKIIAGVIPADKGAMRLEGSPYSPADKLSAERQGVRLVMQELNLVSTLTVAENIYLPHLPKRLGFVNYRRINEDAARLMAEVGLDDVDAARKVGDLSVGRQQLVEIAAGLSQQCKLLILDEPTAALTDAETELLFTQIAKLKAAGVGIVYISHRMEEIKRISDRITVLRDGQMVATHDAQDVEIDGIVREMVGRDLGEGFERHASITEEPALRVDGLRRGDAVKDVSFEVRKGEILGFAGLMGSGRTEAMRAIFGADRAEGGSVFLGKSARPARIRCPRDAVRHGIALLTEDRKAQGLLLPLSIRINTTMANLRGVSVRGGVLRKGKEEEVTDRFAKALSLRYHSQEQAARDLSGGNQQKVVLAKWLFRDCDVLIFDEPTRGIDVGAKLEIYRLLDELASRGKAIIVVSSDMKELLALCDRIAVMSAGRLAATFNRGEWSQDAIMSAALSGYLKPNGSENAHA